MKPLRVDIPDEVDRRFRSEVLPQTPGVERKAVGVAVTAALMHFLRTPPTERKLIIDEALLAKAADQTK